MQFRLRRILVLGLCLAVVPAMQAQDFGVMAGGSFSKFGGADVPGELTKTRVGLAAGVFGYFRLSDHIGLEPEALFVQKGGKGEEGGLTSAIKLSYIELPLLLKLRIPAGGDGSQVSPHVSLGGAVGFQVGCKVKASSGGTTVTESCEDDPDAEIRKTDFSLVFGAGVDIGRATLGARFDLGLTKLDASTEESDIKNRTFYLLVGWTFRPPR